MIRFIFLAITLNGMDYPINTFQIDNIRQILLHLYGKYTQDNSLISILTIGLRNGNEKTGRILGLENEILSMQIYTQSSNTSFNSSESIIYMSL